ncbi:hypothetical protein N7465_010815 [Penicillium sp. CMV-2018d]|nr:hypothetical protein N7465_010815 [Penicillium sp. CMV-2018d]
MANTDSAGVPLENVLKENLGTLLARLNRHGRAQDVVQVHYIFKALASDLITFHSFDQCLNLLDAPDYGKVGFDASDEFFMLTHLGKIFPWLMGLFTTAPTWIVRILFPHMIEMRDRRDWWTDAVMQFVISGARPTLKESNARFLRGY